MTQTLTLQSASQRYAAAADRFAAADGTKRLWQRDATLWTGADEADWLGWLHPTQPEERELAPLRALAAEARNEAIEQVVVMGMGGSSLCPDVLAETFAPADGYPRVRVLDSTVPGQITSLRDEVEGTKTWFVVPSKSGGTIEPNAFLAYFFEQARQEWGDEAGARFIAITDPGSSLEARAASLGFRAVLHGIPSVGGRFSALSAFGLLPAALQGIDLNTWLEPARAMARACGPEVALADNPGAQLGVAIGALALGGRDKLALVLSPGLRALGAWLEQLVAESTGKNGRGVVPIDGGPLPAPGDAGEDRLFVYVRLAEAPDLDQDAAVQALSDTGQPVIRIDVARASDLAGELFRWEFATAVAGAVLEVNPFDQPDVESAKREARALMTAYEETGSLPERAPLLRDGARAFFADRALSASPDAPSLIASHFARAHAGDYLSLNVYLPMEPVATRSLERLRTVLANTLGLPVALGFGPRFLHSTGQLHKGGANNGVFLQLTAEDPADLSVPGQRYSFGVLKQAQARGDFDVLCERGRRILHIHLPALTAAALDELVDEIARSLRRA